VKNPAIFVDDFLHGTFFLKGNTVHFNLQDEHMVHPKNYYFVGLLPLHFAKLGPDYNQTVHYVGTNC